MFFNKMMESGLPQDENTAEGSRYITPGMSEKISELSLLTIFTRKTAITNIRTQWLFQKDLVQNMSKEDAF